MHGTAQSYTLSIVKRVTSRPDSVFSFESLRSKHPILRFRGYTVTRRGGQITVNFDIALDPSVEFRPALSFPEVSFTDEELAPYLFHIGMVELISYWKAACPKDVVIENAKLTDSQRAWWRDLFVHGLGEFFFLNKIDPSQADLLTISSSGKEPTPSTRGRPRSPRSGELVLAAGGKDSSLTLELLSMFKSNEKRHVMILNPTRSARESVHIAGYGDPIIVRRTIDPTLLALNAQGYLNGHTPFSAYLAFLGTMIADSNGLAATIVSNERSASEENTLFHGLPVNHQYSKSIRFERRFREYVAHEFPDCASYFSFIRPLYDLQVSRFFARFGGKHLLSFRSCNVGQREDRWCGQCPKCAFVGLTMAPFLSAGEHADIFGPTLLTNREILVAIEELTGLTKHKPFECVGTLGESRDALVLFLERCNQEGRPAPEALRHIASRLQAQGDLPSIDAARATLRAWTDEHEMPMEYAESLQKIVLEGLS